jgi:GAF domain-containing protein/two-component sensor histidine kinase
VVTLEMFRGWTFEGEVAKSISQTAKQLEAVSQIARKTGATLDLQETLNAIVSAVAELVPCSLAEISLWDKEKENLVLRALRCLPERSFPLGYTYLPGKGYTGWVVNHKKPLWVADRSARHDIQPELLPGEKSFQSYIGLPLIAGDDLIGTLVLVHDEAGAFDRDDLALVETLAGYAAAAIHKARLFEQLSHHHQELAALYSIAETVNRPPDLDALMRQALDRVIAVTKAQGGAIRLLDPQDQSLVLATYQGLSEAYVQHAKRFPLSQEIVGWVAREAKPSLSEDMWTDTRVSPEVRKLLKDVGHRSLAQVPLMAQDRLVGTLGLVSWTPSFFNKEDLNLLNAIGQQLGVAIANAQLFEETQRRAQRLAVLNAIAAVINESLDLDTLLSSAVDKILDVTGVDAVMVRLIEPETEKLRMAYAHGFSKEYLEWLQADSFAEKSRHVLIQNEEPLLNEETQAFPFPSEKDRQMVIKEGIGSSVEVPLRSLKRIVGTLGAGSRTPHAFGPDDVDLLTAIGHQLGAAIENARLRQQTMDAERLAAVGRVAGTVAHDLRGPLSGIINSADFLARPKVSVATRKKMCEGIVAAARRLISTVQGILDYARDGHMSTNFAPCHLSEFIQEVVDVFQVDFKERKIYVDMKWGYKGEVKIDSDRMAQVIHNIVANARDAMPDGGKLTVTTGRENSWVNLSFTDTGPGVPPELMDRIFDPFVSHGKKKGAGLGLSIARRIVEEHGGKIWTENSSQGGATFVIQLPLQG